MENISIKDFDKDYFVNLAYDYYNDKFFDNRMKKPIFEWKKNVDAESFQCYGSFIVKGSKRIISLSPRLLNDESGVVLRNTLIHEMCHQAVFDLDHDDGHGEKWKAWMIKCGLEPKVTMKKDDIYQVMTKEEKLRHERIKADKNIFMERKPLETNNLVGQPCTIFHRDQIVLGKVLAKKTPNSKKWVILSTKGKKYWAKLDSIREPSMNECEVIRNMITDETFNQIRAEWLEKNNPNDMLSSFDTHASGVIYNEDHLEQALYKRIDNITENLKKVMDRIFIPDEYKIKAKFMVGDNNEPIISFESPYFSKGDEGKKLIEFILQLMRAHNVPVLTSTTGKDFLSLTLDM